MTFRIGLIGAGLMMQAVHLPHLKQMKQVEVVALADLNPALGEQVARAYGIPRVYLSAEELVSHEAGLDAVIVVTSKEFHAAAALPALERGIDVFMEKPLTVSLDDARTLRDTARRTNATLMVGYMKRYDSAVLALQAVLDRNELGPIWQADFHDFGGDWTQGALGIQGLDPGLAAPGNGIEFAVERPITVDRPMNPTQPYDWVTAYDEWIEVWIHDVNLARGLFGEPEEIVFVHHTSPRLALVRFEKARVLFEVGHCQYREGEWDEVVTVYGHMGRASMRFPAPLLFRAHTELIVTTPAAIRRPRLVNGEPFQRELVHFFRCLQHGTRPLTDADDAIRDLELCHAIAKFGC